jgi:hypothetical protein
MHVDIDWIPSNINKRAAKIFKLPLLLFASWSISENRSATFFVLENGEGLDIRLSCLLVIFVIFSAALHKTLLTKKVIYPVH